MSYKLVEHDNGWAYRVDGTFSETFSNHDSALCAARSAACEQLVPRQSKGIVWEDAQGRWHAEEICTDKRPRIEVIG